MKDIIKKISIYIKSLIYLILYYLSENYPKDKNLWVFGSWFGEKYTDNSKDLFEYINENHSEINVVWLSRNKNIVELVRKKGYKSYYSYSWMGILVSLKAKVSIFCQNSVWDTNYLLNNKKTKLVQLWHGNPLKKIGKDDKKYTYRDYEELNLNSKDLKEKIKNKLKSITSPLYEEYDLAIACGEEDKKIFLSAFNVKKVKITGYPRNDVLITSKIKNKSTLNVIYLPTFRGNMGDKIDMFFAYGFNLNKWEDFLRLYNLNFYIKMHPVNYLDDNLVNKLSKIKNVSLIKDDIDLHKFLINCDILITDYSNIYFDYLLLNRPIIFAPFDYEEYIKKDRELYYDYFEVTPGPKCKNWDEVMEWIRKFRENTNLYAKERKEIRDRFHKYQDGKSCERVYKEIISLLK